MINLRTPKTILCYGDSNTSAENPHTGKPYDVELIWPTILQGRLGEGYVVINEGLAGRTASNILTIADKREGDDEKNGFIYFIPTLEKHFPVDILIIYLGTNDLKNRFGYSAEEISAAIEILIKEASKFYKEHNFEPPKIILMAPQIVRESEVKPPYQMKRAEERSKQFPELYQDVAQRNDCIFINLAEIIEPSHADGMHLETIAHNLIAETLRRIISNLES